MKFIDSMRTGQVDLPLHYGKAPRWLFNRMVKLAKPISEIIIDEFGHDEYLKKLSNPYFFQAFGCVLGFDWHSSGLTTTLCGALKLALKNSNLGVEVAGGKGKTSKKTPEEIINIGDKFNFNENKINELTRTSKLAAKVDNNLIQDTYQLYHHSFFISENGKWAIIQQGLKENSRLARRYHWLSDYVENMIEYEKPIITTNFEKKVLNLTSKGSRETRRVSLELIKENPLKVKRLWEKTNLQQKTLDDFSENFEKFSLPLRHHILPQDLGNFKAIEKAYEFQPKNYEDLLLIKGMGAKTIRALSLISSLIYGTQISWKDPAKFSYAHGGKDGIPYPVNKKIYDKSIEILNLALKEARIKEREKLKALRRLKSFSEPQ